MKNKVSLTVDAGDKVFVETYVEKRYKSKFIPYWRVNQGNSYRSSNRMSTMDMIRNLTDSEYWLFKLIAEGMDLSTNIATIRGKELSKTEKRRLLRGYKGCRTKDLVRRVKREYYMINPAVFLTKSDNNDIHIIAYNNLK